jgi:hypothetical protein
MSIDKFGRHSNPRSSLPQKGPKGDGFHLTTDGDYDIKTKRLRNVKDPEDELDAVNLKSLRGTCLNNFGGVFNAKKTIITNVLDGTTYEGTDVANKKYVNDNFLRYNYSGILGSIDAINNIISNVFEPVSAKDAANKHYVDSNTPGRGTHHWNFFHKRLTNCSNPTDPGDVVNMRYFQNNCPRISGIDGTWSFSKYRLCSVAKPLKMDDAVNKEYYKEGLTELSYTLYKLTRGNSRASLISPNEWKAKVMTSTPWEDLFKQ